MKLSYIPRLISVSPFRENLANPLYCNEVLSVVQLLGFWVCVSYEDL